MHTHVFPSLKQFENHFELTREKVVFESFAVAKHLAYAIEIIILTYGCQGIRVLKDQGVA